MAKWVLPTRKGRINILSLQMRIILSIAVAALLTVTVNGQSTTTSSTSSTSPARSSSAAAVVLPGTSTHTYLGCYNETTGDASTGKRRALADGTMNATDTMTVQRCLKFCGDKSYAGLEYGREVRLPYNQPHFLSAVPKPNPTIPSYPPSSLSSLSVYLSDALVLHTVLVRPKPEPALAKTPGLAMQPRLQGQRHANLRRFFDVRFFFPSSSPQK
ncbi:MAG: hypothetical protein LQ339_001007 [Xanthoria mediterranea]|nr:MAG: hypothetical protein LQ339_001007 [Xanthoria mediterranea]